MRGVEGAVIGGVGAQDASSLTSAQRALLASDLGGAPCGGRASGGDSRLVGRLRRFPSRSAAIGSSPAPGCRRRRSSASATPARSAGDAASTNGDPAALAARIASLKREALGLKQAGDREGAIAKIREAKLLELGAGSSAPTPQRQQVERRRRARAPSGRKRGEAAGGRRGGARRAAEEEAATAGGRRGGGARPGGRRARGQEACAGAGNH